MRILQSQQEAARFQGQALPQYNYATISAVYPDGVTLLFPGETVPSQRHYPCNGAIAFTAGQRVYISRTNDTYFVNCPILGGT